MFFFFLAVDCKMGGHGGARSRAGRKSLKDKAARGARRLDLMFRGDRNAARETPAATRGGGEHGARADNVARVNPVDGTGAPAQNAQVLDGGMEAQERAKNLREGVAVFNQQNQAGAGGVGAQVDPEAVMRQKVLRHLQEMSRSVGDGDLFRNLATEVD